MTSVVKFNQPLTKTGPCASFLFVVLSVIVAGCSPNPEIHEFSGATMGTSYHIKVVGADVPDSLGEQIQGVLDHVDHAMTTYAPDSELNQLNAAPIGKPFTVSPALGDVLALSQQIYQVTDGAFDPSVGPLVDLWGFGPDYHEDMVPEQEQIQALLKNLGYRHLKLTGNTATREADIRLDLSAIAKGYGVDKVAEFLIAQGFGNFLVEVGGEMRVAGSKPNHQSWQIAVESPTVGSRSVQRIIGLTDRGVATSGDYRNYFEKDGVRYSHTIDPRTGYPIHHALVSVTVLADTSAEADALATAFMVMGSDETLVLAEQRDLAVFLLVKEGEGYKELFSSAFASLVESKQ